MKLFTLIAALVLAANSAFATTDRYLNGQYITNGAATLSVPATTGLLMRNIMVGSGDLIYGGAGGVETLLSSCANGQTIAWAGGVPGCVAMGGGGTVTSVSGTAPIASSGGNTPTLSLNDLGVTAAKLGDWSAKPGKSTNSVMTVRLISDADQGGAPPVGPAEGDMYIANNWGGGYTDGNQYSYLGGSWVNWGAYAGYAGQSYIIAPTPAGSFAGQANNYAYWDGAAWKFTPAHAYDSVFAVTGTAVTKHRVNHWFDGATWNAELASSSDNGFLSKADWATFNGKQNALTIGNITQTANRTAVTGGTGAIIGAGVTVDVDTALLPSPLIGDTGYALIATGANAASWTALPVVAPSITGTRAAPSNITAAGGIAFTGTAYANIWFVQGNGAPITVTANPQIAAATNVGQKLTVIARNDTDTLTLSDGTGLSLNGSWVGGADSVLNLVWDGTNWVEESRR